MQKYNLQKILWKKPKSFIPVIFYFFCDKFLPFCEKYFEKMYFTKTSLFCFLILKNRQKLPQFPTIWKGA